MFLLHNLLPNRSLSIVRSCKNSRARFVSRVIPYPTYRSHSFGMTCKRRYITSVAFYSILME